MRHVRSAASLVFTVLLFASFSLPVASQDLTEYVPAPDGTLLATDVYLPFGIGPWPVVVGRTPYDKNDYAIWCRTLNQHGFACVAQDARGRYASQGVDTVFRDDAVDGRATVEWIAEQGWCDGSIASSGGSAMGFTGYAMAPGASSGLKCLFVAVAGPDMRHYPIMPGGVLRESLAVNWLGGQGSLHMLDEIIEHRVLDEWWDPWDFIADVETVNVAALHFGGWYDMYVQGPIDGYQAYQHDGGSGATGKQYLIMGPWHHFSMATGWVGSDHTDGSDVGELTYPNNGFPGGWPYPDTWPLLVEWLDHCLRGEANSIDSWPPVRVYLMGAAGEEGAPGNTWVDLQDWPPPAKVVPHYLNANGTLRTAQPDSGELTLEIDPTDPVPTLGGPNHFLDIEVDGRPMGIGPADQRPVEARSDVLSFTSEVLARPFAVMGRVTARLWIRPDTPDLDLSVRLTDVYPDGRSMLLLDGIQRARMRCGEDRECFLEPGVPALVEVDLWSTAIVFNTGHRIRVDVAGSNWPRFEVNPNDGGDLDNGIPTIARPELLFGEHYPSAILLPHPTVPRRPSGRRSAR